MPSSWKCLPFTVTNPDCAAMPAAGVAAAAEAGVPENTMEANARGMRSFGRLTPPRAAIPAVIGRKKAVAAVLLMNAESDATATVMTTSTR